jgi:acyl-coenzyme A synthetase/AMP-(fatty) acid ligase
MDALVAGDQCYPVLQHAKADDILAVQAGRQISRAAFVGDVRQLARLLPDRRHILNLCTDRYRFMVGFAAALQRRQVSLLPASLAPAVLRDLAAEYPDVYALTDGVRPELDCMDYPPLRSPASEAELAEIPEDQPALVLFTSGSTGRPKPVRKCWGPLVRSARSAGRRLGGAKLAGATLIGTVPQQHSYGLESLLLLCWQQGLRLDAATLLYPADIRAAIARAPRPRILVTAPVHLRALLAEPVNMPEVDLILSATAPLPVELAVQAEAVFGGSLMEIYGCTEAGQVATRRSAKERDWHCLDGVNLHEGESGTFASGPAVQGSARLHDQIEMIGARRFLLGARSADLVDVAGKRASLAALNQVLLGIPGVRDGVFVMGEEISGRVPRLMALAVAPGLTKSALMRELRQRLDLAFLPRPLVLVEALPRNDLGKLPHAELLALARKGKFA